VGGIGLLDAVFPEGQFCAGDVEILGDQDDGLGFELGDVLGGFEGVGAVVVFKDLGFGDSLIGEIFFHDVGFVEA